MARSQVSIVRKGDKLFLEGSRPTLLRTKPPVPESSVQCIDFEAAEQQALGSRGLQGPAGRGGEGRPGTPGRPPPAAQAVLDSSMRAQPAVAALNTGPAAQPTGAQGPGGPSRQAPAGNAHPLEAVPARKRLRKAGELGTDGSGGRAAGAAADAEASLLTLSADRGGGAGSETLPSERAGSARHSSRGGAEADDEDEEEEQEAVSEFHEANDTQCAQCDDGGNLMSCDGPCMRAFHYGFSVDGEGSEDDDGGGQNWDFGCNPLVMPQDLGKLLTSSSSNDQFLCPNCLANRQQCFKCKREGAAEGEVYRCMVNSCGKFYHPKCVGKDPGEPFLCDLHTCRTCKQSGASSKNGELVPCRRCPLAFHRHCLPQALLGISPRRVWLAEYDEEGNLEPDSEVSHSLLYCNTHKLQPDNTVKHRRPLFDPVLLAKWRLHYARMYPHLESSKGVLAEEARREEEKRRRDEGSDLEDMPLAKRAKQLSSFQLRSPLGCPATQLPPVALPRAAAAAAAAALTEVEKALGAPAAKLPGPAAPSPAKPAAAVRALVLEGEAPAPAAAAGEGGEEPAAEAAQGEVKATGQGLAAGAGAWSEDVAAAVEPLPLTISRSEARKRAEAELKDAERLVTLDQLFRETRRPEPYAMPMKRTIDEDRLRGLERSFGFAADPSLPEATLRVLVDGNSTKEVYQRHDDLMMVLAPFLHGDRYSSYGRHFTDQHLLKEINERLSIFMRDGDQVVDFSCGANEWMPALRRRCLAEGVVVTGRAYDIILARDDTHFVLKSWFDARPETEGLAPGDQLVIGLNPPFGKNNSLADKFVLRAAAFQPRLIVLIVPPGTVIPHGYTIVFENLQMCGGEEFYVPGSVKRSWNKEVPAFRIMVREDYYRETIHLAGPGAWEPIPLPPPGMEPLGPAGLAQQAQHGIASRPASGGFMEGPGCSGMAQHYGMPGAGPGGGDGGVGPMAPHPTLMQQQQQYHPVPPGYMGGGPGHVPMHRHEVLAMPGGGGYDMHGVHNMHDMHDMHSVPPGYGGLGVPPGYGGLGVPPGYGGLDVPPGYGGLDVPPGYGGLDVPPGFEGSGRGFAGGPLDDRYLWPQQQQHLQQGRGTKDCERAYLAQDGARLERRTGRGRGGASVRRGGRGGRGRGQYHH